MEDVILCLSSHENISNGFVLERELHGQQSIASRRKAIKEIAGRSLPLLNPKHAIEFPELRKCDKIFAACWLDASTAALGTKDNQLIIWDVYKNTYKPIPIPKVGSQVPVDSCGIHDIDLNPSKQLLATGGHSANDILIFERNTMTPSCLMQGHANWIFALKFLEDEYLVSASRDSTVKLWKVGERGVEGQELPVVDALLTRNEHSTKVRALGYHRSKKQIATVSADSVLKIWDRTNMDVVASMEFPEMPEMVCMAVDETYDILAVGAQMGVKVIDIRGPNTVLTIDDIPDNGQWGIRSVEFFHHFISLGGGCGRLVVYDLRNKALVDMADGKAALKTGPGWIDNTTFNNPVHGSHHAIYTHKYDSYGGKLLVAGGPIMLGSKGCYAAVW